MTLAAATAEALRAVTGSRHWGTAGPLVLVSDPAGTLSSSLLRQLAQHVSEQLRLLGSHVVLMVQSRAQTTCPPWAALAASVGEAAAVTSTASSHTLAHTLQLAGTVLRSLGSHPFLPVLFILLVVPLTWSFLAMADSSK